MRATSSTKRKFVNYFSLAAEGENPRSETPSSNTATNQTNTNAGNTTPTSQTTTTTPVTTTAGPDEEEIEPPAIVVYLVDPFSLGGTEDPDRRRLAIVALLRAYSSAINSMPENIRSNINVQVIIFAMRNDCGELAIDDCVRV